MICAYHGQNVAVVNCNACGKPLCPSCDHRIKGFPFCQDCIVSGVDLLRNQYQQNYVPYVKKTTSPFVAVILSFICPGLGAAYNGQTSKALVYFGVFAGFFQMAVMYKMPFFALGFIGMWFFAALDAWRTARLIRAGITPDGAEDMLFHRFAGNPKVWALVLVGLGALFFLNVRFLMRGILPVFLIGFGIYLLRDYFFKSGNEEQKLPDIAARKDSLNYARTANEFEAQSDFSSQKRARSWKNQ